MSKTRYVLFAFAAFAVSGTAAAIDDDAARMELAQATTAVQAADRDDAAHYAAADFDEAHAMLDSAEQAADGRHWTDAAMFAERAKVSAELASARSRQHRAEAATEEIARSVDALRAQTSGGAP